MLNQEEEDKNKHLNVNVENQNPLDISAICTALELFPDEDPEQLLKTYNECGKSKQWFLESIMAQKNGQAIPVEQLNQQHYE